MPQPCGLACALNAEDPKRNARGISSSSFLAADAVKTLARGPGEGATRQDRQYGPRWTEDLTLPKPASWISNAGIKERVNDSISMNDSVASHVGYKALARNANCELGNLHFTS